MLEHVDGVASRSQRGARRKRKGINLSNQVGNLCMFVTLLRALPNFPVAGNR